VSNSSSFDPSDSSKQDFALEIGRRLIASMHPENGMSQEYFMSAVKLGADINDEQTGEVVRTLMDSDELSYHFGKGAVRGKNAAPIGV